MPGLCLCNSRKSFEVATGFLFFFLLKSECLVATSLRKAGLAVGTRCDTAAPVVAGGIDTFSASVRIRKTALPDVYLQA